MPPEGEKPRPKPNPLLSKESTKDYCLVTAEGEPVCREDLEALGEEVEEGEADEYVKTFFEDQQNFPVVAKFLEDNLQVPGAEQGLTNFENWIADSADYQNLAEFFDAFTHIPRGRGRSEFVYGLRAEKDTEEFQKSREALKKIVKNLREYFASKREADIDVQKQVEKPLLGQTVGNCLKTLSSNYKRASGGEKLVIAAAIGVGLVLLYQYRDMEIIPFVEKGGTVKNTLLAIGALWGINYMSGKIMPDGLTITQRLDLFRDIDDLSDNNVLKGYAEKKELHKDKELLQAYYKLQQKHISVKTLFEAYQEAKGPTGSRYIDAARLGFKPNEISGGAVYELIDELVKDTAVNEKMAEKWEQEKHTAEDEGREPRLAEATRDERDAWTTPGIALEIFKQKYISGPLGERDVTYFDAVMNEYAIAEGQKRIRKGEKVEEAFLKTPFQHIEAGKAARLPDTTWNKTVELTKDAGKAVQEWAESTETLGGKWFIETASGAWVAVSDFTVRKYRSLIEPRLKDGISLLHQKTIEKVLPEEFAANVTEPGKATIMGMPGHSFDIAVTKGIVTITTPNGTNVDFKLDKGVSGNTAEAQRLESSIKSQVVALLKAQINLPESIKNATPEWIDKKWVVKNVEITVKDAAVLGIAPTTNVDLNFTINADGRTIKINDSGKEIDDFTKLDIAHRDVEIQKAVWNISPYLKDLPVEVTKVAENSTYGFIIEGKIAGLSFAAVGKGSGKSITDGVDLFEYGFPREGGMERLRIPRDAEGGKFVRALSNKIRKEPYFIDPFLNLQSQMENTSEGFFARLEILSKTNVLGFIPSNIGEALNGKILNRQWEYTLDFKVAETLALFEQHILGNSGDKIDEAYTKFIKKTHVHLSELSNYISRLSDEEKANEFQNLLSGKEDASKSPPRPDGLEYLNYGNAEYQDYFKTYKAMITNSRYNYDGLEGLDAKISIGNHEWALSGNAYEVYKTLLLIWSVNTRHLSNQSSLSAPDKQLLDLVIQQVHQKLETAQTGGGIKMSNLPSAKSEADMRNWIK